ncbi:MAG TPA: glutamate--tRNA ligase [Candidatus Marinimicrobia bacterium]|nr:glutamate--tRNA ligase [Candidatus Neomarinimicrobiota bacterium]
MTDSSVRVRFAPSPTGYLHIGGARTALFNYLFARNEGGKFLLRIEDTDAERSSEAMIQQILDSLSWLGLEPDEPPVLQSENIDKHNEAVKKLLDEGKAYRCFCSKEELDAGKDRAVRENRSYRYSGRCRHLTEQEIQQNLLDKKAYTVRIRIPEEGITRFKDIVFKNIEIQNREIDDFIIMRSDGTPVYQLAVVVDDASMRITHVIRGEDHLSNTAKQIHLYLALGYPVPRFAHVPLILAPDGKRLSKRHGATSVGEFKEMGFLPDGFLNGLVHLGWGVPGNQTVFSLDELIRLFKLSDISKKGAVFDIRKMIWINGQHLSLKSADELYPAVTEVWIQAGLLEREKLQLKKTRIIDAIDLLKSRMKLLNDFVEFGSYVFKNPQTYDPEAVEQRWTHPSVPLMIKAYIESLEILTSFTVETLEESLRNVAELHHEKAAVLIHAVRLAVTGFSVSPGLFQLLAYLGRETVLQRLNNSLEYIKSNKVILRG